MARVYAFPADAGRDGFEAETSAMDFDLLSRVPE
jgi:hypothetical protein